MIVKAFDSPTFPGECIPLVVGDRLPIERAAGILGSSLTVRPISMDELPDAFHPGAFGGKAGIIPVLAPVSSDGRPITGLREPDIEYGNPSPAACETTVSSIRTAVALASAGSVGAVCTCPINKEKLYAQGFPFPGHTEFIRDLTASKDVVMMLAGPKLRVALATIHEAVADVPALLTKELLRTVIRITADSMERDFAIRSPRIAVAGLNPHAGEAGKFGREEIEIIRPAIEEFQAEQGRRGARAEISGPWPPDTLFYRAMANEFDAVVAMYHDQGLIPVKLAHFNEAVNVSLGLSIIRTSVDHGTAYDIAGTGTADPGSLLEAVKLAAFIAQNRRKTG